MENKENKRKKKAVLMKKGKTLLFIVLWFVSLFTAIMTWGYKNVDSYSMFLSKAEVIQNDAKVGADIWLKQAIHGLEGIKYRYVIKTDCPEWDFETRYMTDAPISWVDETSAAEVIICDMQVRYEGAVYGNGQYYTVPILGGISSESIPFEDWKDNLIKQAYQTYVQDEPSESLTVLFIFMVSAGYLIGFPIAMFVKKFFGLKNEDEEEQPAEEDEKKEKTE